MKKNKVLIILILLLFAILQIYSDSINKQRWITAEPGLRIRENPNLDAKILGLIPYGERVILIEEVSDKITISGVEGRWSKVKWRKYAEKDIEGWVFGGFLNEVSVDLLQIKKSYQYSFYENNDIGFSFKYPVDISVNDFENKSDKKVKLYISIKKINDLPVEGNAYEMSKEEATKEKNNLQNGKYGFVPTLANKYELIKIGNTYAAHYFILITFSAGVIDFRRDLKFYMKVS